MNASTFDICISILMIPRLFRNLDRRQLFANLEPRKN